jgi:hypothetical protein
MSRQYVLTEQHHLYLNEKAVSLTIILNRPVASRHVLDAIMRLLQLGISIDDNTLRIQVEEKLKTRRDGGKQGKKYDFTSCISGSGYAMRSLSSPVNIA